MAKIQKPVTKVSKKKAAAKKTVDSKKELKKPSAHKNPKVKAESKKEKKTTHEDSLGKKHTCHSCGAKFYDLNKPEIICPKCTADQRAKPITKTTRIPKSQRMSEYEVADEDIPIAEDDMLLDTEIDMETDEVPEIEEDA